MKIGKVLGTVVSTLKIKEYTGEKLLVVKILDPDGSPSPDYVVAIDRTMAGKGDIVLLIDEGNSARQVLETGPQGAVRSVCVGFVDSVDVYRSKPGSFGS